MSHPVPKPVDEMRRSVVLRRLAMGAAAILIAFPVLSTVAWGLAEHRLTLRVERALTSLRDRGFTIAMGSRHRGGWPLTPSLTIDAPRIEGPLALPRAVPSGRIAWGADRLRVEVDLRHPAALILATGARQDALFTPDHRPDTDDEGAAIRLETGRLLVRFDDTAPDGIWFHMVTDIMRITWGPDTTRSFVMLLDPRGLIGWNPDAPADATQAAADLHARVVATGLAPAWARPWPLTGATLRAALVAPRETNAPARILLQDIAGRIRGADIRFAGAFTASAPGTTQPAGGDILHDGSGTLILTGAYAAFERWLEFAGCHAADATMPVRLDPGTIATLRRLLPTTPPRIDRVFLPIRVADGSLVMPQNQLLEEIARALNHEGDPPSGAIFQAGH